MKALLVNHNIKVGVYAKKSIAETYKWCKQDNSITDSKEDIDLFFRLWELQSRRFYFNNQIDELDKEIEEIIKITNNNICSRLSNKIGGCCLIQFYKIINYGNNKNKNQRHQDR